MNQIQYFLDIDDRQTILKFKHKVIHDLLVPCTKNTMPPALLWMPLGQVTAAAIVSVETENGGSVHVSRFAPVTAALATDATIAPTSRKTAATILQPEKCVRRVDTLMRPKQG